MPDLTLTNALSIPPTERYQRSKHVLFLLQLSRTGVSYYETVHTKWHYQKSYDEVFVFVFS